MSLSEGTVLGSYEIIRPIASGGMGTVYRARHVELDRTVALKVISDEIAGDPSAARRFRREARAASRLTHPHICRVYDYHSDGDVHFLVLEYLEGETLKERLRAGRLELDEALRLGAEVADATDEAHRHGLIHRDLKPGNIMLTDSGAKVLDFGAVRRTREPGERSGRASETPTGDRPIGTLPYMSPEQLDGDPVDARSDIYSLGVLLYESVTGRLPYTRGPPAVLAAAILRAEPVPLEAVQSDVDPAFSRAIRRCLAKDPDDRWQTARDLAAELAWIRGGGDRPAQLASDSGRGRLSSRFGVPRWGLVGAAAAFLLALVVWPLVFGGGPDDGALPGGHDPRDLAVLYFEDHPGDADVRHVAIGITESLIEQLDQIEGLSVVSTNGVKRFRGGTPSPDSVARVLGVGSIVDGSVTRRGDSIRVFVQLAAAPSGRSMGTRTIVREWNDLMRLQRDVAEEIAILLRPLLGETVRLQEARTSTRSSEAWELVQRSRVASSRGLDLLRAGAWESAEPLLTRADSLLDRASEVDGDWSEPVIRSGFLALDMASAAQAMGYHTAEARYFARASERAERAIELDARSAAAHELRGLVRWRTAAQVPTDPSSRELREAAVEDTRRSIDLDPDRASAYVSLSRMVRGIGRAEEAALYAEEALRRDMYLEEAFDVIYRLWVTYNLMGDYATSGHWCDLGRQRFPDSEAFVQCKLDDLAYNPEARVSLDSGWVLYREAERLDSTVVELQRSPYNPLYRLALVAAVAAKAGMADSARSLIRVIREEAGDNQYFHDTFDREEAWIRLLLDERERAAGLLRRYLEAFPNARESMRDQPRFAPLRDAIDVDG